MSRAQLHQYLYLKTVLGIESLIWPFAEAEQGAEVSETKSQLEVLPVKTNPIESPASHLPPLWSEAGPVPCQLLVVGLAEITSAQPFADDKGELLKKMVQAMRIPWSEVARVEWRPGQAYDVARLQNEMQRYQPHGVLVMGDPKIWANEKAQLGELKYCGEVPWLATFGLTHLLQKSQDKKLAWAHLQVLMRALGV